MQLVLNILYTITYSVSIFGHLLGKSCKVLSMNLCKVVFSE